MTGNKKISVSGDTVDGGFLQSEFWKKFQESIGRKTVQIKNETCNALMIFHKLPIVGGYFFVPRGPIIKAQSSKLKVQSFLSEVINVAKGENVDWIRVEPQSFEDLEIIKQALGKEYMIVKSKKNHEPAQTIMFDLAKSEEELLAQMKQKTRYNVRLAVKKGVNVFSSRNLQDVGDFIKLIKEAAARDRIVPHPDWYYQKMIEAIPEDALKIYFAKFEGKIIACAMVSFHGGVATYLHGASSNEHRNVMAPFALQWQAIKYAKKAGYFRYDFGGIKAKQELIPEEGSWEGITKFKVGFCPKCEPVEFPGCWDVVISSKKYHLYRFLQSIKKMLRMITK